MIKYLFSTEEVRGWFCKYSRGAPEGEVRIVGLGAGRLGETTKEDILVNIGYVGGQKIPVGTLIEPTRAIDVRSGEIVRVDPLFPIMSSICYTSERWVWKPICGGRAVYDMELFRIAESPHKKVHCIKIVGRSVDELKVKEMGDEGIWLFIGELLKKYLK